MSLRARIDRRNRRIGQRSGSRSPGRPEPPWASTPVSPPARALTLASMSQSTNAPVAARLDRLTWPEAAAWFRRDPRLLLPVGTCLQHGPHLPLGADTIVVERLAEAVSERTGILVAPTLAYGVSSDIERSYAGTAALERKTLHRVLNELVDSWERQGLEEIVLMTAHGYGPHIQAMAAVVADFVRVRAVDIHAIDLAAFLQGGSEAVSYTHLTLPTILLV